MNIDAAIKELDIIAKERADSGFRTQGIIENHMRIKLSDLRRVLMAMKSQPSECQHKWINGRCNLCGDCLPAGHVTDKGSDCWCEPKVIKEGDSNIFVHQDVSKETSGFLQEAPEKLEWNEVKEWLERAQILLAEGDYDMTRKCINQAIKIISEEK